MSPKEYLTQVARAERELKTLRAQLAHYEDLGLFISPSGGGLPGKRALSGSRVESAAVGSVDTFGRLQEKIREYSLIVARAEVLIDRVPQENYRKLLRLRYLCGMSFRSVSDEMRYNDRNSVYRAHGWALLEFGKVMGDD